MPSRLPFSSENELMVINEARNFPTRDRALIVIGLNTGFRASELAALRIGHVWNGVSIRDSVCLERHHLKGGKGRYRRRLSSRSVPLNAKCHEILQEYLHERKAHEGFLDENASLFPSNRTHNGLSRWQVNRLIKNVARAAGINASGRIGSHSLRKSFAKKIFEASGHNLNLTRAIMGHRHVTTTQAYLEVDAVEMTAAVLAI